MSDIIVIENLCKSFGEIKAVDDVSFRVKQGEFFAFLGVNGAGKSTTISIICGQLERDGGKVFVDGKSVDENSEETKRSLGVVFQNSVLDKVLTVYDNLKIRAALYGIKKEAFEEKLEKLDELLGIKDILRRPVGKLSGGQRRRTDIARALLHDPKILILDEPTTGLDPQTRKTVWEAINKLRKETFLTVLLTTHYMEEAADADEVVIIDGGKIVASGTPIELKNRYTGDFVTVYGVKKSDVEALGLPFETVQGGYRVAVKNVSEATDLIVKNPDLFKDYEVIKGKMDDVFLAVTGKNTESEG